MGLLLEIFQVEFNDSLILFVCVVFWCMCLYCSVCCKLHNEVLKVAWITEGDLSLPQNGADNVLVCIDRDLFCDSQSSIIFPNVPAKQDCCFLDGWEENLSLVTVENVSSIPRWT